MNFRAIKGFEGLYEVSPDGVIRSLPRKTHGGTQTRGGNVIKPHLNKGYPSVVIRNKQGKKINLSVHRAVATAFILNPDSLPEVNHIDGNKENNCIDNLEWVTTEANRKHAFATGLMEAARVACAKTGRATGRQNGIKSSRILSDEQVLEIRARYDSGESPTYIANDYGVNRITISRVGKRERYQEII